MKNDLRRLIVIGSSWINHKLSIQNNTAGWKWLYILCCRLISRYVVKKDKLKSQKFSEDKTRCFEFICGEVNLEIIQVSIGLTPKSYVSFWLWVRYRKTLIIYNKQFHSGRMCNKSVASDFLLFLVQKQRI